jgi:transposase
LFAIKLSLLIVVTKANLMRAADTFNEILFTLRQLEDFVPVEHPLRLIRQMVNVALVKMATLFASRYEADLNGGRYSIAPEKLLRALFLQVFYNIRLERQLAAKIQYNLLFCCLIGSAMIDTVWVPTVFTKNSGRLVKHDAIIELLSLVLAQA